MRRILTEYHGNYWLTVLRNDITEVRGGHSRFFCTDHSQWNESNMALSHVNCGAIPCQLWHYSMSNVALFHVNCGTIPCQLWHYSMSNVALFRVKCGTIPCQLWHYSMSTVALFHVKCGTIPCQMRHYSMSTVALFHVNCGTIPCQMWHYSVSNAALFHVKCGLRYHYVTIQVTRCSQANRIFPEALQTFSWFVWYHIVDRSKLCLYTRPTPTVLASLQVYD